MKYGIIIVSIALGFFACQRGIEISSEYNGEFKEQREWLKASSSIFAGEEISLQNQSGKMVKGKLSWQLASKSKNSKGEEVVVIPFTFIESVYKNRKVYNDVPAKEMPSIYSILIKKDKSGIFDGSLRIRSFIVDAGKDKRIFNNLYKLNGELLFSFIREADGNNYPLYETMIDGAARTNSCSVTTTTTRTVNCTTSGGYNTTCTYNNVTTNKYTCEAVGLPEEVQNFQPDEGGGGWYEYEESETEYENQKVIDSLAGYPCAQNVLALMPNLNAQTKAIIQDVFNSNTDINITFFSDISLRGTLIDGHKVKGSGAYIFNGTVGMNPDVLENATKEYILVTFLHESLHAYFKHQVDLYNANQIDSSTFKQNFLIFWNPDNLGFLNNPTELAEHELMANKYLAFMKDAIISFNPSISHEYATALAWGGLEGTRIYATKVGNGSKISLLNTIGRNTHYSVPAGQSIPQFFNYSNYNAQNCP